MSNTATALSKAWHAASVAEVLSQLHTHADQGLSLAEAADRLRTFGPNALIAAKKTSPWKLLLGQFQNVLIIILLLGAALSAFLGHEVESIAIAVIVLFAVLLGFVQEFRAEKALDALRKMAAPLANVLRGGKQLEIPASDVVPGDVIVLNAGDKIPADARVIESMSMHADEAALTGESLPVGKRVDHVLAADAPVGDRVTMLHAGTATTYGRGKAVVTSTGMQTEFGRIAGLLQSVESTETPLKENLDRLGKTLAKAAFAIVIIISLLGLYRGEGLLDVVIFGIALAVAVVPEALPAVVTISLAIGVQRMAKRNALIRRLPAVETLGATTVICSDKTGTLTKDEMTVRRIVVGHHIFELSGSGYDPAGAFHLKGDPTEPSDELIELLQAGALCNDAKLVRDGEQWDMVGDPTEGAIVVAAAKAGLHKANLEKDFPRVDEVPFTSETKRMTTLHRTEDGHVAYIKGAPEVLLPVCDAWLTAKGEEPMDANVREHLLAAAQAMAGDALRVLGIAKIAVGHVKHAESGLTLLGLVGMIDPPRPEAKAAVAECHAAGIKVVMITGDHPVTAQAIAMELGILARGKVVTGPELETMSDAALAERVETIDVYARVSPAHKLKVVAALQSRGHVVAMTGDGVNDAPALKKADIGIAMGITGTDVTKEAAAMTLTDDNFASIVAAVEEGRIIFGNIKKYLMYLLSSNIGEISIMTLASLLGVPLPLSAVQILYVNLATDGLPALALAVDPPESDLMTKKPRNTRRGIFNRRVVLLMLVSGLWSMVANMGLFLWALNSGRSTSEAMTMTFVCLVLIQFFNAYNFRSQTYSVFFRPLSNKWLNLAVFWEILLLVAVVYVPFLHEPFGTFALTKVDWLIIIAAAFTITPVMEGAKWGMRRIEKT
jgi:Ca2+-transporting ATPase